MQIGIEDGKATLVSLKVIKPNQKLPIWFIKKMDVIIFEDDLMFARNLEGLIINSFKTVEVTANTNSPEEIESYIEKMNTPAMFFLDIVIEGTSAGLNAAQRIMESKMKSLIVFITDYPDKVLFHSVYKVQSYNIILKNSSCFEDEVKVTIESALRDIFINGCFVYQDRFTRFSIDREGIIYIETVKGKRKICIYHENGVYMLNMRMDSMIQKLGNGFCRCHDSYIVNMKKIAGIDYRQRKITMSNGGICYYSYVKGKEFLNCIKGTF